MSRRPLLAATLAFAFGIALGAWLPQHAVGAGVAGAAALLAWGVLHARGRAAAATVAGLAAFAVVGTFRVQADLAPLYAGAEAVAEGEAVACGRVARPAELRDGELLLTLEEARVRRGGATRELRLPLLVAIAGGSGGFSPGDLVVARGKLRALRGDRNLGWFPGPVVASGRRAAGRLAVSSPVWARLAGHEPGRGPAAAVLRWRAAADAYWKARPGAAGAILDALTTGERAAIPPAVQEDFLRAGLTHLLAISGMNVAFLAALVFVALRRALALVSPLALRLPVQPLAAALTLPALWFFMLFSGSQIPVGRAVLSSAAGLAAVMLWRRVDPGDALAVAALAILAADPRSLFTPSFQLSFAAVGGLLLVAPRIGGAPDAAPPPGWAHRARRGARSVLLVSLAASAVTAPLVAFHFQQVSLVGPLANLVAVPFTGFVVLPAGWLALGAAAVSPAAGDLAARAACWSADALVAVAAWFAAPAWAVARTARPPLLVVATLLAMTVALLPPPGRRLRAAAAGAAAAAAVASALWAIADHGPGLRVAVLDVGQGLACAVLAPGGGALLYDCGPRWGGYDAGERVVVPALRRLGVWRLDTLALSHAHPDHAGGADAVRSALPPRRTVEAGGVPAPARGASLALGGGAALRLLWPPRGAPGAGASRDENDRSIAALVEFGATGVVLTGDAGPAVAGALAAADVPLPPRLALQVPHHGGSEESARRLAADLAPGLAVISVGRNTWGHPRAGAVAALEQAGRVLRTDRDGAVFIRSDGDRLSVRSWGELARGRRWTERLRWLVAGW
jgi:competence protein ComEC